MLRKNRESGSRGQAPLEARRLRRLAHLQRGLLTGQALIEGEGGTQPLPFFRMNHFLESVVGSEEGMLKPPRAKARGGLSLNVYFAMPIFCSILMIRRS